MEKDIENLSRERPALRLFPTVLSAVLLALYLVFFHWFSGNRLENVSDPARALEMFAGRLLELEEILPRVSAPERFLYEGIRGKDGVVSEVLKWYRELVEYLPKELKPKAAFQLGVLEGENGGMGSLIKDIEKWEKEKEPLPRVAAMLKAVYVDTQPIPDGVIDAEKARKWLGPSWFLAKFEISFFKKKSDTLHASIMKGFLDQRAERFFVQNRAMMALDFLLLSSGCLLFVGIFILNRGNKAIAQAALPPSWSGKAAAAVLIQGLAQGITFGIFFVLLAGLFKMDESFVTFVSSFLFSLPVILLARKELLRPQGLSLNEGFGFRVDKKQTLAVLGVMLAGLGIMECGDWIVSLGADLLNITSHWAEGFDPGLAWGGPAAVSISLLSIVVIAPFFEEIIFRGILFASLRKRTGCFLAAGISAVLFATLHGYGLIGWCSTFISGLLWAWLYEKTGSLVPCVLIHASYNLLASLEQLLLRLP